MLTSTVTSPGMVAARSASALATGGVPSTGYIARQTAASRRHCGSG